ncbi:MAG: glycosyltransferase [Minicystis sp.]
MNEGKRHDVETEAAATEALQAPLLSVVLATYNRLAMLERLLGELAWQTLRPDRFEVVVVDDGSAIPVRLHIDPASQPYRLVLLEQANAGPAAARHHGILRARGEIIVTLDDDMEIGPRFLEAHLAHHEPGSRRAVVGRFLPDPEIRRKPIFERYEVHKWDQFARAVAAGRARIDGGSFASGNASFRRDDYLRVGGFETWLARAEDVSLGFKLEEAGVELVLSESACSVHRSDQLRPETWRRRARLHGALEVRIARMHPALPHADPMRYAFSLPAVGRLVCLTSVLSPSLATRLADAAFAGAEVADRAGLDRAALRAAGLVYGLEYFRGVGAEAGSLRALASSCLAFLHKADRASRPLPGVPRWLPRAARRLAPAR